MSKPKVLWVSDLVTPTGFARVAHSVISNLENDFDVTGLGINYRGDPHQYKFPIYPAAMGGRVFGEDRLASILNNARFDVLFILNDVWVIAQYLRYIKENVKVQLPRIVVYFPVDAEEHDPEWYKDFDIVNRAVTYTEFGRSVVNNDNCVPDLKLDVVPHGTEVGTFYKKFTNRKDAKKTILGSARDPESFLFLNANRNQPRKRLDITLEAFKMFLDNGNDGLLHMHCGVRDAHIDVAKLARRLGVDNKLVLTNLNPGVQTVPDGVLNDIYNAADVGINSSMGEGWGLCAVEHAATGAPQIVGDHSACRELFGNCGVLVQSNIRFTFDRSMTVGRLMLPEDLAAGMEKLYKDNKLYNEIAEAGLKKFTSEAYSWKTVAGMFASIINEALGD